MRLISHYSLLRSTLRLDNPEEGMILTDISSVSGAVQYIKACKEKEIQPNIGCQLFVKYAGKMGKLCLIAKNKTGWQSLLKLVTLANKTGHENPFINFEDLISDGLICVDGFFDSLFSHLIIEYYRNCYLATDYDSAGECLDREWDKIARIYVSKLVRLFDNDFYFEKERSDLNISLVTNECIKLIANEIGVETYPASYTHTDNQQDLKIVTAIKLKTTLNSCDEKALEHDIFGHYITHMPACKATQPPYLDKLESYDILSLPNIPHYPGVTNELEHLRELCREGWRQKIDKSVDWDTYGKRVKHELSEIEDAGLAGYFLIVQDYVNEFKRRGYLIGAGRGSGAGSMVGYLLGITGVDPIKYDLLWERFWSNARKGSLPDYDVDFPPESREEVIEYLKGKYGEERVSQMITFGRLQGKSAIKEVLRVEGNHSYDLMNKISEKIPSEAAISDKLDGEPSILKWTLENMPDLLKEFVWLEDGELHGEFANQFRTAIRLEGLYKSHGKHAAGVIVCSYNIEDISPLIYSKDRLIAALEMGDLEAIGAVKFDILGLSALTKLKRTVEEINKYEAIHTK